MKSSLNHSLSEILTQINLPFNKCVPVSGGDINQAYCLFTPEKKFFLKINDAERYPDMFQREAEGLKALKENSAIKIPGVIRNGVENSIQFLMLEWMESGAMKKDFWEKFGETLADLHKNKQPYFGFETDNYIGSLSQENTKHSNWPDFYIQCRIMPLVKQLADGGSFSKSELQLAEKLCRKFQDIFPEESAALLHGDLWSGNFMIGADGYVAMYDPAVYYGHREMDLGMTLLFGGFDERFYETYNEIYPLEKKWKSRVGLTQLYPLLVHAILFGGGYGNQVKAIIKQYAL
jgi:protein-ribulosamine 3-kinase